MLRFSVAAKAGRYSIDDPGRLLRAGPKYTLYRPATLRDSGRKTLMPLGYVKAARSAGTVRELSSALPAIAPQKYEVASGDVIIVRNAVSKSLSSDRLIAVCGAAENRGQVELQNVQGKVFGGISQTMSYPFVAPGATSAIDFMFQGQGGFQKVDSPSNTTTESSPEFCIQPIQKIEPGEKICKKDLCQIPISVKLGAALLRNGSSLVVKAVEQKVTTPGFHSSATPEQQAQVIKISAERAVDQTVDALKELVAPAFEAAIQQQAEN
jgi:hypothetical protein